MKLRSSRVTAREARVLPEAKRVEARLRCVRHVRAIQHPFFAKVVRVRGIPILAAQCVQDSALVVAADRLSRQLSGLPAAVVNRLITIDAAFHVIGRGQVTSDLPEHAHMRGVDGGYTKELGVTIDQRTRGMGGLKSSCGEENLLNIDDDPCYHGRDILTHEFAHAIMDFGLPPKAVEAIRATHAASVASGLWRRPDGSTAYAGSNASEYWAELSMWYFGTHGEFVDPDARTPAAGPAGLARYDPEGFALLGALYDGSHAAYAESPAEQPSVRIEPLPRSAPASACTSIEGDGEASVLVLRNSSRCDAQLLWVDASGAEFAYGTVPAQGVQVQHTFAGHVWRLVPQPSAAPAPAALASPAPAAATTGPSSPPSAALLPLVSDVEVPALPTLLVCAVAGTCIVELWAGSGARDRARRGRGRGRRR